MTLADQQLRQELMSFGETVPPITQRNREQLRARLEVLQSRTRTRTPASPSRSQATASPSRSQATASPSRATRAVASPARTPSSHTAATTATSSPSRTNRATASPVRAAVTSSPARTRSSMPPTSSLVRPATRSQQTTPLIEISDSDTESTATTAARPRSAHSGQTTSTIKSTIQTRSTATRRQNGSPASPVKELTTPVAVFGDVEQSIARHRREIKQLLDSARDRNRANNPTTPPKSTEEIQIISTPIQSTFELRTTRKVSKSDTANVEKHVEVKPTTIEAQKSVPTSTCSERPCQLVRGKCRSFIKFLLTVILVGSVIAAGVFFLLENREFFAPPKAINCSAKDATTCEDMKPLVAAVRKQLQIRAGEVECGFREKTDILVGRAEINKYLDNKGLTFIAGDTERWNALVNYIVNGDANDILLWNKDGKVTKTTTGVEKLSSQDAKRSLICRVHQDIPDTTKNGILICLGSTGLLTLLWYIRKLFKLSKKSDAQVKQLVNKITVMLKDQYEKHVQDSQVKPWISVKEIRDSLALHDEQERLNCIWQLVQKRIHQDSAQLISEIQEINGEKIDVWRWSKSSSSSPQKVKSENLKSSTEETEKLPTEAGLTECLKLRNCFRSDKLIDDGEIDQVIEIIRKRCAAIKQIDHIGVNSIFVYMRFASKEAAAQGYHLLNEWNCQNRPLNVKYIRLSRYFDHFPEARVTSPK